MKRGVIVVAAFAILATPAVAAPKQVKVRDAAYGGLGANVSSCYTHNAHASGNPACR